jgi:hypothetical protein
MKPSRCSRQFLVLGFGLALAVGAGELRDDFSTDPFGVGDGSWRVVGDAASFHWDKVAGALAVTWDSSRENSFCVLPLGRAVSDRESVGFACDLTLTQAGPRPGASRPQVLQISIALVRQSRLPGGYPQRTSSGRAVDLLDFTFFPLADYGPFGLAAFVSPAVFGEKHAGYSFGNSYDLADGQTHRIECAWDPGDRRLHTRVSGAGPIQPTDPSLPADDPFSVDALAIVVWNEGPTPQDSLLALGTIDNVVVTRVDPASAAVGPLSFEASTRTVRFGSQSGFRYQLEASGDLEHWSQLGVPQSGTGAELAISDLRKALFPQQFYRVRAEAIP